MWIYFWNIFFLSWPLFLESTLGKDNVSLPETYPFFSKNMMLAHCAEQHGFAIIASMATHIHVFFCQKPDFGHWQVAMKATCVSCGTMAISFPTASWFTAQSSCHSIFWRHDQNLHKGGNPIQGGKASDDPRWPDSPLWRKAIPTTQANLSPHHPISVWPHCGNECQLCPSAAISWSWSP